ncbi:MAG: hypothetical protein KIT31_06335 [Deltaproteobacteria bacterium]|nr:hypothetical protein [Deltaproteobacteria bacterium]
MVDFPRPRLAALQEIAARLLDSRAPDDDTAFARELLSGFHDVCMRYGLDGTLAALDQAYPPIDIDDRGALAESYQLRTNLVARLGNKAELDRGGPRAQIPVKAAECVVNALGLTLVEPPADRGISLGDDVRNEVVAAIASVIDEEIAAPRHRARVIAIARSLIAPGHEDAFERLANELDERGMKLVKQPKVPIVAVQAAQRAFFDARVQVVETAGKSAIDRALPALARASEEAAARIDRPVTHRLTPRQVAIARAADVRIPRVPAMITQTLLEGLAELADLAFKAPERIARKYAASQTFAVGELIEHPKFGIGTVATSGNKRIEVDFPDGRVTLVQAPK